MIIYATITHRRPYILHKFGWLAYAELFIDIYQMHDILDGIAGVLDGLCISNILDKCIDGDGILCTNFYATRK